VINDIARIASLCKEVANELGIFHSFCEPNNAERKVLGITGDDWFQRESEWLVRLRKVEFPVLFICGSYHVDSFSTGCIYAWIETRILERNWAPVNRIPLKHLYI
jgi:hypothetical protein